VTQQAKQLDHMEQLGLSTCNVKIIFFDTLTVDKKVSCILSINSDALMPACYRQDENRVLYISHPSIIPDISNIKT